MEKSKQQKFWRIVKWILVIYVAVGILLYFIQEKILFHPKAVDRNYVFRFDQPFTELNIPVSSTRNLNVVKFTVESRSKGIVLYFHGNRQNIERYAKFSKLFTDQGFELWMMDYPGFGKSTGDRNEQAIYQDAMLLYRMAIALQPSENIIIYGKSIGTGVASQLASVRDCRHLVLETPYYNIDALAKHYFPIYPVNPMSKYSFPVNEYLPFVKAPVTIFHGTRDEVIPYKQAKRLKKENPNIRLITIDKGKHNNLSQYPIFTKTLEGLN
ncbi:MAG: lysophospholipase [Bacteroidota bacterium]|nr:lysophospholipase [Bacteroidota bacterium]